MQLSLNGDSSKDECASHEQLPVVSAENVHSHHARSTNVLGSCTHRVSSPADPMSTHPTPSSSDSTSESLLTNSRKRTRSNLTDPTDSVHELESSPLAKRYTTHLPGDANSRGEPCSFPVTSTPPPTPPDVPLLSSSDVYCAEFVVFDSRQQCQLVNGDYELLLQKCPSEEKKMEDEMYTTWDTVFGTKVLLVHSNSLVSVLCIMQHTFNSLFSVQFLQCFEPLKSLFSASSLNPHFCPSLLFLPKFSKFEAEPVETLHLSFSLSWHGGPPKSLFSDTQKTVSDLCALREGII